MDNVANIIKQALSNPKDKVEFMMYINNTYKGNPTLYNAIINHPDYLKITMNVVSSTS